MVDATPRAIPVVLLTDDPRLVTEVTRVAAAAGRPVLRTATGGPAPGAALLLGPDALGSEPPHLPAADPVRVVVALGTGEAHPALLRAAMARSATDVVLLPADELRLLTLLTTPGAHLPDAAAPHVVTVLAGHGGAGASTLATALALETAGTGAPVLLVDLDPHGCGLDLHLRLDRAAGPRWPDLLATPRHPAPAVAGPHHDRLVDRLEALPHRAGVRVLAHSREARHGTATVPADLVPAVLGAVGRGGTVVVDVGRAGCPAAAAALRGATGSLLVSLPTVPGLAASRRAVHRARPDDPHGGAPSLPARGAPPRPRLVLRGPLTHRAATRCATALGLDLAGVLPHDAPLSDRQAAGGGPADARGALRTALRDLGLHRAPAGAVVR